MPRLEAYASARIFSRLGLASVSTILPRLRLGIDGSALPASIVNTTRSIKIKLKPQQRIYMAAQRPKTTPLTVSLCNAAGY